MAHRPYTPYTHAVYKLYSDTRVTVGGEQDFGGVGRRLAGHMHMSWYRYLYPGIKDKSVEPLWLAGLPLGHSKDGIPTSHLTRVRQTFFSHQKLAQIGLSAAEKRQKSGYTHSNFNQ